MNRLLTITFFALFLTLALASPLDNNGRRVYLRIKRDTTQTFHEPDGTIFTLQQVGGGFSLRSGGDVDASGTNTISEILPKNNGYNYEKPNNQYLPAATQFA